MLRNAPAEAVLLRQMRMRQMIDTGQKRAEHLAVGHDATDGDATEIDAMIAALAADQAEAGAFAPYAMIGDRHLKGGIHRFRAGIGEEHMIHALRRNI